jgi:hypothetical protein
MFTIAEMDRAGIGRHAELFSTLTACRQRFEEIKAQLHPGSGYSASAYKLPPQPGVPGYVVAVVSAGARQPRFVPKGRVVELPEHAWVDMIAQAYAAERQRRRRAR